MVAVGADRDGIAALDPPGLRGAHFVLRVKDFPDRAAWDRALARACAEFAPDLVVLAGFMKLVGPEFLRQFGGG